MHSCLSRVPYKTFTALYSKGGYRQVGKRLAKQQPKSQESAILGRFHSQALFMDEATLRRLIIDVGRARDLWQQHLGEDAAVYTNPHDLLLSSFMTKLTLMVAEGADLMGATWMRYRVFPKIKDHFCSIHQRLAIVEALNQTQDAAKVVATINRLKSPDVERELMDLARGMAPGSAGIGFEGIEDIARGAMDKVKAVVILPEPRPLGVLTTALEACSVTAVRRRKEAAVRDPSHE